MIGLIMSLFSVAGSAGFGSFLKLVSSGISARRDFKLAQLAASTRSDAAFQAVFAPGGQSNGSQWTRRVLAIMLVGTISFMGIYSVMHTEDPFVTFIIPEARKSWGMLWGLLTFPQGKEITVTLTLGHLALTTINICALAVGFYFTPSGRR